MDAQPNPAAAAVHPQKPSSSSRDVLHRAIYDYFLRLSKDSTSSNAPTETLAGRTADTTVVSPSENLLGGIPVPLPATAGEEDAVLDQPAEVNSTPEKLQRVLNVLEQEFPEIKNLPAESEEKPLSALESRFTGYPQLQLRVSNLESQASMSPLTSPEGFNVPAFNPPPDDSFLPPSVPQHPIVQPTVAGLLPLDADAVGMVADPLTLPPTATAGTGADAAVATATTPAEMNEKKRKAPSYYNQQEETIVEPPSSKKLKEQATEIQKMKSQLKRAQNKIQQLSRGSTAVEDNQKEKAMAAAVPFEQRYQEMVHFQRGHGHCRVPCTSKDAPGLARWVQTLRAAYKEKIKRGTKYYGQLTDERQKKLEEIGFEWSIQSPKLTWEQRFEELKAYKEENGHCRVVRSYAKNPSLGEWCHRQRFLAHKNQLEAHKVQQMTDLGFEIWVRSKGKSWEDHFAKLLDFRRKNQNLQVPAPDTRTKVKHVIAAHTTKENPNDAAKEGDDTALEEAAPNLDAATEEYKEEQAFRRWVVVQRDNYHLKYKKGIKSTLNNAKVKKLDSIGFDWTREGGDNDLRKLRRGELHHRNDPNIWKRRFAEVIEYKKKFGDCNIPKEWPENKQLGAWVSTQRKMYKAMLAGERSSMTAERRNALESIGFTWILRPARTRPKILEIEGMQRPEML